MSQVSKNSRFGFVIPILAGLLLSKGAWVALESLKLPKKGVELEQSSSLKPLYYHYSLASKKEKPKVVVKNGGRKPAHKPKPKPEKITKFILTGVFDSSDKKIIALNYLGKSYVINLGESVEGYKFVKLYPEYAVFKKDGKEYRLDLFKKDAKDGPKSSSDTITTDSPNPNAKAKKESIERAGDTTFIPKNLFNKYRSDIGAIRKNIGVVPNMVNGKLDGFKINFVKRGSDFDKLGVKRGDIITAINGEPLNNFKVPLEFFNNLDSISAATLTIKRGNEIKELEYEVR